MPADLSLRQRVRLEAQAELVRQVVDGGIFTVLDLGVEHGHSGRRVKQEWPQAFIQGVEVHGPTLDRLELSSAGSVYDSLHREDAVGFLAGAQGNGADSDIVIAAELVEHLQVDQAMALARLTADRARRLAIVTSPLGWMPQGELDGNPHQVHVTGWRPEDLEALGYRTWATFPELSLFVSFVDKTGLI